MESRRDYKWRKVRRGKKGVYTDENQNSIQYGEENTLYLDSEGREKDYFGKRANKKQGGGKEICAGPKQKNLV